MQIAKMFRSFVFAYQGIRRWIRTENNAQFHMVAGVMVLALAWFFEVETWEWCVLILCIFLVLGFEALNTGIEKLCDKIHPEKDEWVAYVKDISAGAVLLIALMSVLIGGIVFLPKILNYLV